jgi:hypothetical protein
MIRTLTVLAMLTVGPTDLKSLTAADCKLLANVLQDADVPAKVRSMVAETMYRLGCRQRAWL